MRKRLIGGAALLAGVVLLGGCAKNAPQDTWKPAGTNAQHIQDRLMALLPAAAGVLVPPGYQLGDDYEYMGYSSQEMNEFAFPMLYLWRREEADSGGPGRYRGGVGASSCFIPYDSPLGGVHLVVSAPGKALPLAAGLSGVTSSTIAP